MLSLRRWSPASSRREADGLGAREVKDGIPFAETIAAQPGRQTEFLRSPADMCIYGGAAGGGKTAGLILEPLRHVGRIANFTAVFFRRTMPQITNPERSGMRA